jgi:hypothetical protein
VAITQGPAQVCLQLTAPEQVQNRGPGRRGVTAVHATDHLPKRPALHIRATHLVKQGRIEQPGAPVAGDIKPEHLLHKPAVAYTFAWTRRLVEARGWQYEVWSGAPPAELENLRFLSMTTGPRSVVRK